MSLLKYFTVFEKPPEGVNEYYNGEFGRFAWLEKYVGKKVEVVSYDRYYRGVLRFCDSGGGFGHYVVENEKSVLDSYHCKGTHIRKIRCI